VRLGASSTLIVEAQRLNADLVCVTCRLLGEPYFVSHADAYRQIMECGLATLTKENYEKWLEIASVPESIRGFGHVKQASVNAAQARWNSML